MTTAYLDEKSTWREKCEVRIDGDVIVVSYKDERGPVVCKGNDRGNEHFELFYLEREGHATLHRFDNSTVLEGYWVEGTDRGFWRVELRD